MKKTFILSVFTCLSILISFSSFTPIGETGIVKEVLSETNQFRSSQGLSDLIMVSELNAIAQKHSEDMAGGRVGFGHTGFEKRNNLAAQSIKPFHSFAENVAYGARSGKEVVKMWKNSSGHRRNMLGKYKYIGIGIATNKQGQIFYTQVFAG
ncbi:MAG: CAP domain-containing protein [Ferruginibacter sp.]